MKVLFLQDDFPPESYGGAGISTYELALGVKEAGHEVFVITTCRKPEHTGKANVEGLTVFTIHSNYASRWRAYVSLYNPSVIRKVKALLGQIKPDVVHINNVHFYLSYHCFKLAKKYAPAVVFTARDVMVFNFAKLDTKAYLEHFDCHTSWRDHMRQAGKRWNPLRNFLIKRAIRHADGVCAVSHALKEALEQNGFTGVRVVHTGIDPEKWHTDEEAAAAFKREHALEGKKVVLFGGRLSEVKGGGKAVEALALIRKDVPDALLLVTGENDAYAREMKEEAKRLGVDERLMFTGWLGRDEMRQALSACDVVVVPTLSFDSFPRVVLEAMALEKPVLGTCYGGARELIEHGVTGYVINPFNTKTMAREIRDLLVDSKKAERFGKAGHERVIAKFRLQKMVGEYSAIYVSALERHERQ